MSRFRKVDPRFWKDEKIIPLPPVEKLIVLYLFTGQSNRIGLFSFSPGEAAEDLSLSPETFREGFGNVCQRLNFGWDETFRVLYLPTWWKYNVPENTNNVIGNLKDLDDVPNSPLIEWFINNLQYLPEPLQETFTQTLAKRYPQGYPKRSPSQEQEQEQEQEEDMGDKESPASPKPDLLTGNSGKNTGRSVHQDIYEIEFDTQIKSKYPERDGDQRWKKALSHYRAARKTGEPTETILAGVQRYRAWCERKSLIGTDKVKQAATFLGPEKCWRETWEVPKAAAGGFVG